jgi:hypothetical protein
MSDNIGHWIAAFVVLVAATAITLLIWQEMRE